ncbi:MAG TPA: glycosyltransferase family protein [Phycisphaerae bacterium]|nr:glycosyltransferase family protein [Phycisphaerae bacterium]HNU44136.1 glycosyltransferase family protein [Phycisphaerae bacterium]
MTRILYAAAGEGLGHATRAHSVALGLMARGHEVRFVASHQCFDYLTEAFPGRVDSILGLRFSYGRRGIRPVRTACDNAVRVLREFGPASVRIREVLRSFRPAWVITDFEPFTAFWCTRVGIPFVSLDNQHLLTHGVLDLPPGLWFDRCTAYLTVRLYLVGARRYFITTFIDAPVRYQPTTLLPPILRPAVYGHQATEGGFVLVYKSGRNLLAETVEAMERFDRLPIVAYGFERSGQQGHITYKPPSIDGFVRDLAACAGVVASAGHSLLSECFHFGKPMLVTPIAGQYEQFVNAHYVEKLGAGRSVACPTAEVLEVFVESLDGHRAAMRSHRPQGLDVVLDALEREMR